MTRVIEVVDYNPNWIVAFEKEAGMLAPVFARRLVEVHHIGSTAVPGLQAKPIIDILVVLDDTGDINSFNLAMEAAWLSRTWGVLRRADPWHAGTILFQQRHERRSFASGARMCERTPRDLGQACVPRLSRCKINARRRPMET